MSEHRLEMAEAYYTVARDMERQGRYYLEVAKTLNTVADSLCEQNILETKPTSTSSEVSK